MSFRVPGFILAALLFVGYRVIKPRAQASDKPERWSLSTLFLASTLTLFAELAPSAGSPPRSGYLPM